MRLRSPMSVMASRLSSPELAAKHTDAGFHSRLGTKSSERYKQNALADVSPDKYSLLMSGGRIMRCLLRCVLVVSILHGPFGLGRAEETCNGSLIIIGGGLLPNNSAVFARLIEAAGGRERARFGIFPTAGKSNAGAKRFAARLIERGIPEQQILIFDVTLANAAREAESPSVVEQICSCTAIYFAGGDQNRITRALLRTDGSPTKALQAVHTVWRRGGVIAGSSAGAAIQSEAMISVSGLPDESLDEGMDALDFGLTKSTLRPATEVCW